MNEDDGPTLRAYMETRFALLEASVAQRFEANKSAVDAAFAAQKEAVLKAEMATEKRFESVNEFRGTLDNQQRTLIPRSEVEVMRDAMAERVSELKAQVTTLSAERRGLVGGWGYAVGLVGVVLALVTLFAKMK